VEQDPAKLRPSDTPVICCDRSKLTNDTGWAPQIPLEVILSDALQDWRGRE
ncbi:MAG: GDP-mannose 4,6 dehydratase, partial [Oscillospiraceae bacterium]|nr:GDP-mannose 4,6 dehydratase [Oscillospiraceae bacterium]